MSGQLPFKRLVPLAPNHCACAHIHSIHRSSPLASRLPPPPLPFPFIDIHISRLMIVMRTVLADSFASLPYTAAHG